MEDIPLDDFGRPSNRNLGYRTPHDETRLPVRHEPPPFSHYRHKSGEAVVDVQPTNSEVGGRRQDLEDKDDAGCCKCVIM